MKLGTLSIIHSPFLRRSLRSSIFHPDLCLAPPFNPRSHVGMLVRPPCKRHRVPLCPRFNFHLCRSKHLFQETLAERIIWRSRRIERIEWRSEWRINRRRRWKVGQDEFIILFEWHGILLDDPHLALLGRIIPLLFSTTDRTLDHTLTRFILDRFTLILLLPQRYRSFRSKLARLFFTRPNFARHLLDRFVSETNRRDLYRDRVVWTKNSRSSSGWDDHVFRRVVDV